MNLAAFLLEPSRLVHLSSVDLVIIIFYFALVLAIGLYLKGQANTGEDFFMAGREMTAWVAGLAFLSANLGSLELLDQGGFIPGAVARVGGRDPEGTLEVTVDGGTESIRVSRDLSSRLFVGAP